MKPRANTHKPSGFSLTLIASPARTFSGVLPRRWEILNRFKGFRPLGSAANPACLILLSALLLGVFLSPLHARAADAAPTAAKTPAETSATNAPAAEAESDASAKPAAAAADVADSASSKTTAKTNASPAKAKGAKGASDAESDGGKSDEIQLSFQGAQIDMVVQWLAQTTGKSVVKHPQVQCQLTITSSKKLPTRQAIDLVYRALSLEGFTAVESSNSILIVPEGKEPKMNPELLDGSKKDIPEGRQRLVKIFRLAHIQATELREKVRGVLSEKGSIDADNQANQLVVTDYNDNLRLLAELIKEFDVSASGLMIEIYPLKHTEAEEVANLLGLIISAQASASGGPSPKASRSSSSGSSFPGNPMMMMGGGSPPGDSGSSGGSGPPSSTGGAGAQAVNQNIRIWADKNANRLIVSAPKSKLTEIQRLVDILDTDKPEDVAVRVLPLKNVNAQDVVKEVAPLYQRMSGRALKDMIEIAADDRSSSLVVLSSEANFKSISKLMASLDAEDASDKVMRTFTLKNADAEDISKQLMDLNKDQDSSSRMRYFYDYYGSSQNHGGSKKLSVVADRRRNSVIVQAPLAQMDGLEKMIAELDEPADEDALAPKIYHLKYASSEDIKEVLDDLFLKKTQTQLPYFYYDSSPEPTADRDVGRLYGKVRITSEPYSNTLIVTSNSKESISVLEDIIKQLDAPSEAGESTLRIGLRFAKAIMVANSINILFAKNGSPALRQANQQGQNANANQQPQQQKPTANTAQSDFGLEQEIKEEGYYPWLGGQPDNPRTSDGRSSARTVSDLVGRVRAVPDQRGNAVLLSANVHFFPQVLKLIEELDAPTAQVLIEARIVEVSSDFMDQLGVRWSPDGSKVFTSADYDNSLLVHGTASYLKGFGGLTEVNQPSSSSSSSSTASSVAQALTSLRSGTLDSTINMDFLIQFLKTTTSATVLAAPQINIEDNETGKLFVGQQVPFIDNSVIQAQGGQNNSFTYKDVGIILEVTPHINSSGDVSLKIHAESSSINGQTILNGAVIDSRNFKTDLEAKNGQTLVLGGIIQRQVSDTLRKTPLLGDIPGLGWAFKKKDKTTKEVELMVFLRPRVVRTPEDAQELLRETDKKSPLIKKFEQDIEPKLKEKAVKQPVSK
jgi:type II secretion system protein D